MWNAAHSMMTVLAAAERGESLTVTETEIRERLDALIKETQARRNTLAGSGEYQAICKALDRMQAEHAA